MKVEFPKKIFSGYFGNCHCQGIAVDEKRGYVYYSFTTLLVKTDLMGNLCGTVEGLCGHLGCITYDAEGDKVYGALEFKRDLIGVAILEAIGEKRELEDGFYCAIFDASAIDRVGMSAENDGVMRCVYLSEVLKDYSARNADGSEHRYACSGIDGTSFGRIPGESDGKRYLFICYGVYGDTDRADNDYQVILCYDALDWWDSYAKPLWQEDMHKSGPQEMRAKFFLYTGNTEWGIQNLEYDAMTGDFLVAVYRGKKAEFPNYTTFVIDGKASPRKTLHRATGEEILELSLKSCRESAGGISGSYFPLGSTGIHSLADGNFYFSDIGRSEEGNYTELLLFCKVGDGEFEAIL